MQGIPIAGLQSSLQKTERWLSDIGRELGWSDPRKAYQALRGGLHALRDRLPLEEAAHLGAQLPMVIRGLYYEGWAPARKPAKLSREQFLERIRAAFGRSRAPDPANVARAVFHVLQRHVTPGELRDVCGALPRTYRDLWDADGDTTAGGRAAAAGGAAKRGSGRAKRDSGRPGGGRGRRDVVGGSGVYPASAEHIPDDALARSAGEWGGGPYEASGRTQPAPPRRDRS